MDAYYKNEPLRTYGVPINSYDYVDEYDSMTTADRISAALASLNRSANNRKTADLAYLADIQDLQGSSSPEERDLLYAGSRSLSPAELEVKALKDRGNDGVLDVNAILEGDEFNPSDARREEARMKLNQYINPPEPIEEMGISNIIDEDETERQAKIQAIRDQAIKEREARSDALFQKAVDEGRITFGGKNIDDVLSDLDRSTTTITDQDMADRITARKEDPNNKFEQFRTNWFD